MGHVTVSNGACDEEAPAGARRAGGAARSAHDFARGAHLGGGGIGGIGLLSLGLQLLELEGEGELACA